MLTNSISITISAPTLSHKYIETLKNRTKQLYPLLSGEGIEHYLCELLNIGNLLEITGDFLVFQELEPAVSSEELYELASRVVQYSNGDIDEAIFSVRNILNTVPQSIDDLIDYTTEKRKKSFIKNVLSKSMTRSRKNNEKVNTVYELINALKDEPTSSIAKICDEEMVKFQSIREEEIKCLTTRQKRLENAGNYYLNHLIGFDCNTVWLAYFICPQIFGCPSGWTHHNGSQCKSIHFGFKNGEDVPSLVFKSIRYIVCVLESAVENLDNIDRNGEFGEIEDMEEAHDTASMYISTMLYAIEELIKNSTMTNTEVEHKIGVLFSILDNYSCIMCDHQKLYYESLKNLLDDDIDFSDEQFSLFVKIMTDDQSSPPDPSYYWLYDAWNFFVYENHAGLNYQLSQLVMRIRFNPKALTEFSDKIINILKHHKGNRELKRMCRGFFEGYCWNLVNQNSEHHFLFDQILEALAKAKELASVNHVVRLMAEFGHKESMKKLPLFEAISEEEHKYWLRRISLMDEMLRSLN